MRWLKKFFKSSSNPDLDFDHSLQMQKISQQNKLRFSNPSKPHFQICPKMIKAAQNSLSAQDEVRACPEMLETVKNNLPKIKLGPAQNF